MWGSANFNLPDVQIVLGVLASSIAALVALRRCPGFRYGHDGWRTARRYGWRERRNLGIALPSLDYLAVSQGSDMKLRDLRTC